MNHLPPSLKKITLGLFQFFQNFAEIFASQGAPSVATTPMANNWNNIIRLLTTKSEKCIYMLTLLPKGVQPKELKLF
jgi:hypothetical protein